MSVKFAKQPNGKFCRVSSIVDAFTDYNMTEQEFRQELMNCNYGYCCDYKNHISAENEDILRHEIENPAHGGKFLIPFEECLCLAWNYAADEISSLRKMLKKMGYAKYAVFYTKNSLMNMAREEILKTYFGKKRKAIINYLIDNYIGNDKYCCKLYRLTADELSEKVESIKTYDDLKSLYDAYFYKNFSYIGWIVEDIPSLNQYVDYETIDKMFRAQFDIPLE